MVTKIQIITGDINAGKTTAAEQLCEAYRQSGFSVAGVLAKGSFEGDRKVAFTVHDLHSGQSRLLAYTPCSHDKGVSLEDRERHQIPSTGRFLFDPHGFAFAEEAVTSNLDADVIIIDELGILELREQGFYDLTRMLLDEFDGILVLVIRKNLLEALCEKLEIEPEQVEIIPINERRSVRRYVLDRSTENNSSMGS
jgi:nucleoside-triphosphatase THEP1